MNANNVVQFPTDAIVRDRRLDPQTQEELLERRIHARTAFVESLAAEVYGTTVKMIDARTVFKEIDEDEVPELIYAKLMLIREAIASFISTQEGIDHPLDDITTKIFKTKETGYDDQRIYMTGEYDHDFLQLMEQSGD